MKISIIALFAVLMMANSAFAVQHVLIGTEGAAAGTATTGTAAGATAATAAAVGTVTAVGVAVAVAVVTVAVVAGGSSGDDGGPQADPPLTSAQ